MDGDREADRPLKRGEWCWLVTSEFATLSNSSLVDKHGIRTWQTSHVGGDATSCPCIAQYPTVASMLLTQRCHSHPATMSS
jgi:hypothetical protein